MPWLNKPQSLLSSSQALNCHHCYTSCLATETTSFDPLKHCPSANQFGKKAARVAFSDCITVNEIPPAGTLHSSSASSIWWSREDYSRMLLSAKLARSKTAENRQPISDRSFEVCTPGLEGNSGSKYQKRRERRIRVTNAVFTAQENQRREGITDPVYIATLSRSFTSASAQEAYLRANDGTVIEIPRIEESITDQDLVEIRI